MNGPAAAGEAVPATRGLLPDLAAYAAHLRLEAVPERVRRQAALCILDTVGCIVAGSGMEEGRLILPVESAREGGGSGSGEATVLCAGRRLSVGAAVRVNGYLGDLLELNDLIGGHASIGVVTAALALAEARRASGAQLLAAVIAGIEVTARVYGGYYADLKPFTEVGMSAVGFPSTIGVAAAAAHLMALDEPRFANALANAGALAGWCPAEAVFGEGGSIKPMLFGSWPGTVGIMGAEYALHGVTGPLRLLESRLGFFATAARKGNAAAVRDRDTWHLAGDRSHPHRHAAVRDPCRIQERAAPIDHRGAFPCRVLPRARRPCP